MSDNTDYYNILEISNKASDDEIKKSYRRLAKLWHPDKHKENTKEEAERRFKIIAEAYEVLSNPEKRKIYDMHGIEGLKQSEGQGGHEGQGGFGFNPFEMFKNMFGSEDTTDVPDCVNTLNVNLEDLYNGITIKQEIERYSLCDKCNGKGTKCGINSTCNKCKGQGMTLIMIRPGMFAQSTCRECHGTGIDQSIEKCKKCNGNKFFKENIILTVNVPKGVYNKYPIVINEEGNAVPPEDISKIGKTRSDAVFVIVEKSHTMYKRGIVIPEKGKIDFSDLLIEIDVPFVESIVGFNKEITHLDGRTLDINIDEPCRHGDIYVIIEEGMPKIGNAKKGDLFVKISVDHPRNTKFTQPIKQQLYKLITGNEKLKLSKRTKNTVELVHFDKYKINAQIQSNSDSMREEYQNRRMYGKLQHQQTNNDSDDNDDNNNYHHTQSPPECRQM